MDVCVTERISINLVKSPNFQIFFLYHNRINFIHTYICHYTAQRYTFY